MQLNVESLADGSLAEQTLNSKVGKKTHDTTQMAKGYTCRFRIYL